MVCEIAGLTARMIRVIQLAEAAGRALGNDWLGTEHFLIAFMQEAQQQGGGVLSEVLKGQGIDFKQTERATRAYIAGAQASWGTTSPKDLPHG